MKLPWNRNYIQEPEIKEKKCASRKKEREGEKEEGHKKLSGKKWKSVDPSFALQKNVSDSKSDRESKTIVSGSDAVHDLNKGMNMALKKKKRQQEEYASVISWPIKRE